MMRRRWMMGSSAALVLLILASAGKADEASAVETLKPLSAQITMDRTQPGNPVVAGLRRGHNGNCIRIHGGNPGAEEGILIHEAPHVGWLTGCISPRPKDNHGVFDNADGNPSYVAMDEIMTAVNSYARGRGSLFVMV